MEEGSRFVDRRTSRRRHGDAAEALAARILQARGWSILGRQVRVGRLEIDLIAIDPGPPSMLVAVEVRSRSDDRFGAIEERLDEAKLWRTHRALAELRALGRLPGRLELPPGLPARVDLLAVELSSGRSRLLSGLIGR